MAKTFLKICVAMSIACFFILKPNWIQKSNIYLWAWDDRNYLAHATAVVFGEFPNYQNEIDWEEVSNHAPGMSYLAVPFMWSLSLIDRINDHPIVKKRTMDAVPTSWTVFGFAIASQFYLLAAALLLALACRDIVPRAPPAFVVIISILACGLPIYAYRRPTFTPVHEAFVIAAALFIVTSALVGREFTRKPFIVWPLATFVAILLVAVRYNDAPISIAFIYVLGLVLSTEPGGRPRFFRVRKEVWISLAVWAAAVIGIVLFVKSLAPEGQVTNVDTVKQRFLTFKGFHFYFVKFFHVIHGSDWGLLYSAPLVVLGLAGLKDTGRHRPFLIAMASALAVNAALAVSWGTQASYYGYRYFVFSALPLATVGLAAWLENGPKTRVWRYRTVTGVAVLPVCMMLLFEKAQQFYLDTGANPWGAGEINFDYTVQVVNHLLFSPRKAIEDMFVLNAGLAFLPHFPGAVRVKAVMCVLMPLVLGGGWYLADRLRSRRSLKGDSVQVTG